jgi:hypothetical protein
MDPSFLRWFCHISVATIDSVYQSPPESDSEGGREVYTVGDKEELPEKTTEEIQQMLRKKLLMQSVWIGN